MFLIDFKSIFKPRNFQEIYQDRQKFSEKVFEVASCDLINMGITVVSYTIKDIRDDEVKFPSGYEIHELFIPRPLFQGYLNALGMKRTAEVKRDARIGEAEALRDKTIKVMRKFPEKTNPRS
jgi:flotillin